ncbi:MAG: Xaa-Pro peptidase family protein [Meiothermus sp.]|uniref:M24 family metallopeptidase n=1 Tax=Meiothermus sp. TaxID=1955249 RepID=UPI0025D04BBA|nr:Xaa-Pro peptidase family protein [Meiothermus sp.]MCS7193800.1 Xaa-Pro peptidase family protein [Meiothermus sp.]MDW8090259.1 Xaa-Pro peptidase family protein [Meiothermus sp.]
MDFAKLLENLSVDVLYVSNPYNVRYVSGFVEGKDAKLVITPSGPVLITDGRYLVEASEQPFPYRILQRRNELAKLLAEFFHGRVGFEAEHLSVAALESLKEEFPGLEFVPTRGVFEGMRRRKNPEELEHIRKAAALADRGFQHILGYLRPGVREIEIALELEFFLRREGSEGVAFGITVASGERGAQPHGGATPKIIQAGELVTLDFGAVVGGYRSDMTRTVAVGQPSEELRGLYQAVLEAQQRALEAVAPGRKGAELDALARGHLEQKGYGAHFTHSLGHGVGLCIHEGPSLGQTSEDVLEPDQVITIEPGVYIPGKGGCRIEDLVRVTEGGFELLSQSPKELIVL